MESLKLLDLLRTAGVAPSNFKIHCAKHDYDSPLAAFLSGTFKQWQERQNQKNFPCAQIVSLIHLQGDRWLFAGVWDVLDVQSRHQGSSKWFEYSTREVRGLGHLTGRVVVKFKRTFRASYLRGERYAEQLEVAELRPSRMTVSEFPGYASVILSFDMLQHIIRENIESWRGALKNVAGVYVITDRADCKHYVGSAYGAEGIWGRWALYAIAPDGGNEGLNALLREKGAAHAKHFQFAILEICDPMMMRDEVIARENRWKQALCSRELGHNKN